MPTQSLSQQGFVITQLPDISETILDSYNDVELDPYMAHGTRYKRFSQYRLRWVDDSGWEFEQLPHRAYSAFKKFNPVAGGILREYSAIEVDFTPIINSLLSKHRFLDDSVDWQINVHQNRSKTTQTLEAPLTPEGIHQDGHEFVIIAVLNRKNVTGGTMRLWPDPDAEEIWSGMLNPGEVAILDDRRIYHDVTPIVPTNPGIGTRDILIVSFSRWQDRWYGEQHEIAVLADT